MVRRFVILIIILAVLFGMYTFGTRNASVTLTESLQVDTPLGYQDII